MIQEQHELTELTGCDNFEQVVEWFGEMTLDEIAIVVSETWGNDDGNCEFSTRLYNALN